MIMDFAREIFQVVFIIAKQNECDRPQMYRFAIELIHAMENFEFFPVIFNDNMTV